MSFWLSDPHELVEGDAKGIRDLSGQLLGILQRCDAGGKVEHSSDAFVTDDGVIILQCIDN